MPRIALLTRYDSMGASSRVRTLQYLPSLHKEGIETEFFPLLSNDYLEQLYAGRSTRGLQIQRTWKRIREMPAIAKAGRFDLLWIEKELLPYLPYQLERHLLGNEVPYALDFDDAIFHNYDQSSNPVVQHLLGNKIDRLMAGARLVTCGNSYLAERAKRAGAPWVEILPSTIDFEKYRNQPPPVQPAIDADNPLRLVWIGSPSTAPYLELLRPVLTQASRRHPIELRVIGANAPELPGINTLSIPWKSETEAAELAKAHVGVMPLKNTPWEQGKCGFKLIQYMATGLPVIGSAVGMNKDIVLQGETGFLASNTEEWVQHIGTLAESPELRARMGKIGEQEAETHYSIAAVGPQLAEIMKRAASTD